MKKKKLTKYDTNVKGRLVEIEAWARDGLIEEQIAKNLGVAYSTFKLYKKSHSALSAALKKGKEVVDIEVENALLQKAIGIKETVKKAIKVKEVTYDQGKRVKEIERIEYADEEVYIPPDVTAQIFWLKNRKPEAWRDRKDVEHSGEVNISSKAKEIEEKLFGDG